LKISETNIFQIENFSKWKISELNIFQIFIRRFLLLTWATIKLEEAARNPPKDAVGTRRASPKFLLTSVKLVLQLLYCNAAATEKGSKMTTVQAAQRRAILANVHAKYFSSRRTGDDSLAVACALTAANVISSTDRIVDITFEGTTLVVHIDYDKTLEAIELDAYGNILRGEV
jgi:hypothetical protein